MSLCPNCTYKELPNKVANSKVKSYVKIAECSACAAQREADAVDLAAQEKEEEKNLIIAEKMRQLAIDELKYEGVLDENEDLVEDSGSGE